MKIASVADVKARFSTYVRSSQEGPIVVTRNGKPVAVLLSMDDEEEIERLVLAYSPRFRAILDAARGQIGKGGGLGHDDFWNDLEKEVDEKTASK
jgi:prevent-host-death family protein